jgi:hypothetical protein
MQVAMVAPLDMRADGDALTEVFFRDAVYATLAEDALTHALALLVGGLDLVDPLRTTLVALSLLVLVVAALLRGLLLLLSLLTLSTLGLLTLLPGGALALLALLAFGTLGLLALPPLYALLIALAAFGTFNVALTLTLDALRALGCTGSTLYARSLFGTRLTALYAGGSPLGRCGTWRRAISAGTRASVFVLRLGEACARQGAS